MTSVVIMSLSLLMLAVFLLATDNLLRLIAVAQNDVKVYAYLEEVENNEQVQEIYQKLFGIDGVQSVVFVSKEEALVDLREQLGDDGDIIDALESNPLPNSFWITPRHTHKDSESLATIADSVMAIGGVEDVRYGREFIERFSSIIRSAYYIDAVVGFIVILSAIFIIANAVRLTVIGRRKTIEILKLVGATNRFIMLPFIIEGAFQGGLAALISLGLLIAVTILIRQFIPDIAFFGWEKAALYTVTCIVIGSIGSFAALRRHLHV